MKIKVAALVVCLSVSLLGHPESKAAGFPSGKNFSRIQTCTERTDIYANAKIALEGIGYSVRNNYDRGIDLVTLSSISTFGNLLLWASHGGPEGYVMVEQSYATWDDADFRRTSLEATAYRPGDLEVFYVGAPVNKWGVALTLQGISDAFSGSRELAFVGSCYGTLTAGRWGAHEVGYEGLTYGGTTQTDMTAVFERLTAAQDYSHMTVANALNGQQVMMRGDGDIALMPWVTSYSPTGGDIATQYFTVTVTFGGSMSSVNFTVGGVGIKASQGGTGDTWWVQVQTGWAKGNITVKIDKDQASIANGIKLKSEWSATYNCTVDSYPPAASVEAFVPFLANGGVMIQANFGQLRGSKALWVNRQDGSLVGDTIRVRELEGHGFELFDPRGTTANRYHLYERDHRGICLRAEEGVFEIEPEIAKKGSDLDPVAVERVLRGSLGLREASLDAQTGMIICPDSFVSSAQILSDFWGAHGRSVTVVPLSQTGRSRDQIKAYIEEAYAQGVRYVLLAGCASDCEWFDDPSKWPDHISGLDWYYWYQDYHTPGGQYYWVSHPERNLIPTWYYPDTLYDNMSY